MPSSVSIVRRAMMLRVVRTLSSTVEEVRLWKRLGRELARHVEVRCS